MVILAFHFGPNQSFSAYAAACVDAAIAKAIVDSKPFTE